uniref:Membrane protein-like protein n=1 Tax=Polynucleobacter necessarius subsp. necessarius (strain STIR1) TaxID=452638 RepID=B1XUN8_POLNS
MIKKILDKNPCQLIATAAFVDLFILCVSWEWFISPLRPGGSWLILKGVPLLFAIPGLWKGKVYTMQWASMLILLYVTEGLVRILETGANFWLATLETLLATVDFVCLLIYLKPIKQKAKALKKLSTK